jgi:hypothetical protein
VHLRRGCGKSHHARIAQEPGQEHPVPGHVLAGVVRYTLVEGRVMFENVAQ